MSLERRMLSFVEDKKRFNHRVAGIAIQNDHILLCREDEDDFVLLPGGRIEFGEESAVALGREIAEELKYGGVVNELLFTAEDYFHRAGEDFHEIGIYYRISLVPEFPFVTGKDCLVTQDEGHDLQFTWVPIDAEILTQWNLVPHWLRHRLRDLPNGPEHVIHREQ